MNRRIFAFLLALVMVFQLVSPAIASADDVTVPETTQGTVADEPTGGEGNPSTNEDETPSSDTPAEQTLLLGAGNEEAVKPGEQVTISVNGKVEDVYFVSDGFYQDARQYDDAKNFYIDSLNGLEYFRDWVNGCSPVMNHYSENGFLKLTLASFASYNGMAGKNVYLLSDIDLTGKVWQPIGPNSGAVADKFASNWKAHFYGNFYGGNHVIKNMDTSKSDQGTKYSNWPQGFFGSIAQGNVIDGLIFENANVVNKFNWYAGVVVGDAGSNPLTISNCVVRGTINVSGGYSGAIVGIGNVNVRNCTVTGNSNSTINGDLFAGGLVGAERCSSSLSVSGNYVSDVKITGSQHISTLLGAMADNASGNVSVTYNKVKSVSLNGEDVAPKKTDAETNLLFVASNSGATTQLTFNNNEIIIPIVVEVNNVTLGENGSVDKNGNVANKVDANGKTFVAILKTAYEKADKTPNANDTVVVAINLKSDVAYNMDSVAEFEAYPEATVKVNDSTLGEAQKLTNLDSEAEVTFTVPFEPSKVIHYKSNGGTEEFLPKNTQSAAKTFKVTSNGTNYDVTVSVKEFSRFVLIDQHEGTVAYNTNTGAQFTTLAEAVAAASAGDTIVLLANCEGNGIVVPQDKFGTKGLTVDFGDHTYTLNGNAVGSTGTETSGFQLLKGNTLTFKNGSINVVEGNANFKRVFQSYANVTFKDMTVNGSNLNGNNAASEFCNGNVIITGSSSFTSKSNVAAINVDAWNGEYPDGAKVTVNTTGTISGIHCYTEGTGDAAASALAIEAGTITALTVAEGNTVAVTKAATVNLTAPADYKWNDEGKLVAKDYVAKIGETKYETLAEAFAAAQNGETITLLKDVNLTDRLFINAGATPTFANNNRYATTSENKALTLDLNDKNITTTSNIALAGGSLTITGTGKITSTGSGLAPIEIRGTGSLDAKRTLVIGKDVTLEGGEYGLNIFGSNTADKNEIDVTINGTVNGTVFVLGNLTNAANDIKIDVYGKVTAKAASNEDVNVGIALNGNANVTVNAGAEVSGESGIEVRAGNLTVNGGTITATAPEYSYTANNSGTTTKGAAIAVAQHTTKLPVDVTLNGGTLNGAKMIGITDVNNNMSAVTVVATQSFTQSSAIPEDYKWVEKSAGKYTLEKKKYVAEINGKGYETLAEAIAEVPTNGTEATTITMLANSTEGTISVNGGRNIVLDLGDHKVTSDFMYVLNGKLTAKNGTIANTVYVYPLDADNSDMVSEFTLASDAVIETADGYSVILYNLNGSDKGYDGKIDIAGKLNGNIWVMGNIKEGDSVINFSGNIESAASSVGIALNGNATVNVTGGTIAASNSVADFTGIEVRAGKLNVSGGTITGKGTYSIKPNGSGTTTTGAGIAVAQHTTELPILVTLSGGTITGTKPISVADPEGKGHIASTTDSAHAVNVVATQSYTENAVIPEGYKWVASGSNYTLKAIVYVTVTFNSNGGTAVDSQTVEAGQLATEPTAPTKDGYTFKGWFADDAEFDFTKPIEADTTLTAQWDKEPQEPEEQGERYIGDTDDINFVTQTYMNTQDQLILAYQIFLTPYTEDAADNGYVHVVVDGDDYAFKISSLAKFDNTAMRHRLADNLPYVAKHATSSRFVEVKVARYANMMASPVTVYLSNSEESSDDNRYELYNNIGSMKDKYVVSTKDNAVSTTMYKWLNKAINSYSASSTEYATFAALIQYGKAAANQFKNNN